MSLLSRSPHFTGELSHSAEATIVSPKGPRLLWKNFNVCPHCQKKGRSYLIERLNERGPVISRSDGVTFHLVLGDRPISYPAEKASGKTRMLSAGFWYLHDANGDSTETVVVILRKPPSGAISLLRQLETVADELVEKLRKSHHLSCLYQYDDHGLRKA